ncbi:peroxide stress protein YaaA [Gleimia sp. 6138-11-ORH1]|uniref:YaaA family protein n=1 Tax=Gleimia sp. 6138-11-ORH1 TaxID=2973937 RepID=UPI0021678B0F|nr:peroxide stress protein YaaA [Gleimia sp. 6138-11-ORH1]MCS4484947.1 peroxide stress protein YaaA [Gleimia sp. 6138-11-ORH1]
MLVLLPPSEGKTTPNSGPSLDLPQISPLENQLKHAREQVLTALGNVSAEPNALELLGVGASLSAEVAANTQLTSLPCAPAHQVYSGVLFEAGKLPERGENYHPTPLLQIWVQSALFGLVDLNSFIPAYRLSMSTKLAELGALATFWKTQLTPLLAELDQQLIVDCRSGSYQKAWPALETKQTTHQLLRVNVVRERNGKRTVVSHNAKKFRGILAGVLMERAAAGQLENSLAGVMEAAQSLIGQAEVIGIETKPGKGFTELIIVTS